jgi:hypothetical protein
MDSHQSKSGSRHVPLMILLLTVAVSMLATAGMAAPEQRLPRACKLLTRAEAQVLAAVKLLPPVASPTSCTYNGLPTGPVAQVSVYVDSSLPRTLRIDRELGHKIWRVPGLGDQAFGEEWNIFVRKGKIWLTIHLVRTEAWGPSSQKRLERAARTAISRVKSTARRLAAVQYAIAVSGTPPTRVARERWRGKERRFGGSITRADGVVYQPDVVLIGGGADAVRARSPDGLTWTIDRRAPGAAELRAGKIMVATTFAAGRVLKISPSGSNLRVILGPVQLTEVIRDGVFKTTRPVPLSSPLRFDAPLPRKPQRRALSAAPASGLPSAFAGTSPICCSDGVGLRIAYDNGAGRLAATVRLYGELPTASAYVELGGGRLVKAWFEVRGAAGLRYDVWGATENSSGNVRSGPIAVPGFFSIPLTGPFAITLTQAFYVSMQFAGKGLLRTSGDYAIRGKLGFGFGGGSARAEGLGMAVRDPITLNTVSLGVGQNALSLGWAVRATVGIGFAGFSAGPWVEFKPGIALNGDGHPMSLKAGCVTAAIDVRSAYGIGFTIPKFVRSVVNAFLSVFKAKPVPATGGPSWGPYVVWRPPTSEYCPPREKGPS